MTDAKIWMDGSFVSWNDAKIHVLTHGLHYGTAVFEGIRCYKTHRGLAIFRLSDHILRLSLSAKIYFMNIKYSKRQIENAVIETINVNEPEENYVRVIAYYGYGKLGVNPLPNKVSVAIAIWKWDESITNREPEKGARLAVSSWTRIDSRSMPTQAKATANYANSALARMEALKMGFDEAVMLNPAGKVIEASAENIFVVRDDVFITPPVSSGALNGITRDSILAILHHSGSPFEIRDITREELYMADEVFLTGTAAGIREVGEIDNRMIGDGCIGKHTMRVKEKFHTITQGRDDIFSKRWLTYANQG
jgi:branched-chain amino acid aminotransferase